ncbi:MAG: AI-2E family transporter [Chitinophagaceae bacterium]|nr:AI-2E family transporter [Chitinophagaceae bacterium]
MSNQIHPNTIRQVLFLTVVILLAIIISREMYFMLSAFLGAVTLYVIMRNSMIRLIVERKWKRWVAALTLILVSFMILIVPIAWLTSVVIDQLGPILQNPEMINIAFEKIHQYLIVNYQIDILKPETVAKINEPVLKFIRSSLGGTLSGLGNVAIMYFILYFMLVQTSDVESWLRRHVPFKNSNVQIVLSEVRSMVYSNAIGIPIVAIIQGLVGLIGYWIFGVEQFILMGILTAICSVIPVVGSMAVYLPLMAYQLAMGHTWQGVAIALWGFILIGSVDNIARFTLLKKMANVHPLITIFGVFVGINMFGVMGIIFGPLLFSLFFLLIKIYIDEFGNTENMEANEIVTD